VRSEHLDRPTPCRDWTVRQLLQHVCSDPRNFITMAQGGDVDWSADVPLPDDPGRAFREDADELLELVSEAPDAVSIQLPEFTVHAWDLAQAIGGTEELDDELAKESLRIMRPMLKPEMRGDSFDAEVTVADDASPYDRLAAFTGRQPQP
jgi:uncharacterized protein (TIGR03086 family)